MSEDVPSGTETFLSCHRGQREELLLHDGFDRGSDRIRRKGDAPQNIERNPVTENPLALDRLSQDFHLLEE